MPYGITTTGFSAKPLATILSEIEAAQRAVLGADLDTSAESVVGALNAPIVTKLRELWELAESTYNQRNPRGASYAALDIVCALTGVTRLPATQGTVTLSVQLNAGITLPMGSVASVTGEPTNRWVTNYAVTNSGGSPAWVNVPATAETAGRYIGNAGTIAVIATPVSGWTAVTNALDAAYGRDIESDTALRARRDRTIRAGGSSPLDAIRAALLDVTDVLQVSVFENPNSFTSGGMLPHSVRAIVTGGTDLDVATALWAAKGGGIQTNGSASANVLDENGTSHTVRFDRPTSVSIWITVSIERDLARYAGDDAVKTAILALEESYLAGDNVRRAAVSRAVLVLAGVEDVTEVLIGRSAASQVAQNAAMSATEIANLDGSRITIVQTDVTP